MLLVLRVVKKDVHDQVTKFLNDNTIFRKAVSAILKAISMFCQRTIKSHDPDWLSEDIWHNNPTNSGWYFFLIGFW